MPSEPRALLFPGQGAQHPGMLEPFRGAPGFRESAAVVSDLLGFDLPASIEARPEILRENAVSSLATVLASVAALRGVQAGETAAVAGYSVGQWTALHAAGSLPEEALFRLVHARARLMDEALAASAPSGMTAVIGLRAADVAAVCGEVAAPDHPVGVTNDNAPGQVTIGGTLQALDRVEARLSALRPKALRRLAVAGAWHSPLMAPAAAALAELLRGLPLASPRLPVVENVAGDWLTGTPHDLLARQVAAPVRWMQSVRTLAASGIRTCLEVGYGDVLTRFGFFIDRSLTHLALAPPPRGRA
ncbi:ACP S-malonyltransferase [Methylobacterium nonmethylotrophicum]|uniref:[acyl-carrier-protein] S-malonyltransferase n=1 Tax=Methylobacterium nonmethylotrophicum TaxID=1141884 RepID=A0A4Z0NQB3_9HYPH|nr:ACP S-malonyltransferase [Methylobacterium nonmethylotrophicum]TGD98921.1 ACP S-malonyltransferase [Methylobacterium nonmethylotrophicum]